MVSNVVSCKKEIIIALVECARAIINCRVPLTVIGVLFKLAWVEPLQSKRGEEVCDKLRKVIDGNRYRYL